MTDIEYRPLTSEMHRPLNEETLELDTLAPKDREVVEKIMADLDELFAEQFIGKVGSEDIQGAAESLVASMNERAEDLRLMAEHLVGQPVKSCTVKLDGIQGRDLLMSHQIEFDRGERYQAWLREQDDVFAAARQAAAEVLQGDSGHDGESNTE